jgi:hypothetical protein
MRTAKQNAASRENGARSRGPVTAEGKKRVRLNAVSTGCRAKSLFLPGESPQEFAMQLDELIDGFQPRNSMEFRLVHAIARADWMCQRVERAHFERLKAHIEAAGNREDLDVDGDLEKLFAHPAGPYQMFGLTRPWNEKPPNSSSQNKNDPNKPFAVVQRLEGSAKGCQALLANWKAIFERVDGDLEVQPHDKLKAIRMLGKQPIDAVEDKRVALIFDLSFALRPREKESPYDDLKSEMSTPETRGFVERVRRQWGLLFDMRETPKVKEMMLDLISRNIERLEAKLEVHLQHADERAASTQAQLPWGESPEFDRLARYELATSRRAERLRAAFIKLRKEVGDTTDFDGLIEDDVDGTGEGENITDSGAETGVVDEASSVPETNLTNEPEPDDYVRQDGSMKEVASLKDKLDWAQAKLRKLREARNGASATPATGGGLGRALIEQAIFAAGPLLPPIP